MFPCLFVGEISRADVADTCINALEAADAGDATFEVYEIKRRVSRQARGRRSVAAAPSPDRRRNDVSRHSLFVDDVCMYRDSIRYKRSSLP